MGYRYKLTPLALSDIDDALNYIGQTLSNPSAADKLYRSLMKEIDSILDGPFRFPDCSYYLIDDENIRHTVIGNYVLIFEVDESDLIIKVLRFLYGGRDINAKTLISDIMQDTSEYEL